MRIIFGSYPVNQVYEAFSGKIVQTKRIGTRLILVVYVDGKKIAES